jgi:hypothetical protein
MWNRGVCPRSGARDDRERLQPRGAALTSAESLHLLVRTRRSRRQDVARDCEAWQVTYLVIGLGIAFTGLGLVTLFGGAVALLSARKARKVTIPETAASLTEPALNAKTEQQ